MALDFAGNEVQLVIQQQLPLGIEKGLSIAFHRLKATVEPYGQRQRRTQSLGQCLGRNGPGIAAQVLQNDFTAGDIRVKVRRQRVPSAILIIISVFFRSLDQRWFPFLKNMSYTLRLLKM